MIVNENYRIKFETGFYTVHNWNDTMIGGYYATEAEAREAIASLDRKAFTGTVYYASKKAQQDRYYREGEHVTVTGYHNAHYYGNNFVEINLDSSGTSYIHLTLDKPVKE
jgi:hypothetical protein